MCSSVHVPKVHTESNHGCGCSCSHLPRSPYDYMVVLFFAVVVHYAGVYVYMYIHVLYIGLSWTSVLSASFLVLSSTVISYP